MCHIRHASTENGYSGVVSTREQLLHVHLQQERAYLDDQRATQADSELHASVSVVPVGSSRLSLEFIPEFTVHI